jgi:hypothetical protein
LFSEDFERANIPVPEILRPSNGLPDQFVFHAGGPKSPSVDETDSSCSDVPQDPYQKDWSCPVIDELKLDSNKEMDVIASHSASLSASSTYSSSNSNYNTAPTHPEEPSDPGVLDSEQMDELIKTSSSASPPPVEPPPPYSPPELQAEVPVKSPLEVTDDMEDDGIFECNETPKVWTFFFNH